MTDHKKRLEYKDYFMQFGETDMYVVLRQVEYELDEPAFIQYLKNSKKLIELYMKELGQQLSDNRSCKNCKHQQHGKCTLLFQDEELEIKDISTFSCSKWE